MSTFNDKSWNIRLYCFRRDVRDIWYKIKCLFVSKQNWLLKKIPRTWVDKDTLFEICILEGLKHYVEKEGALDNFESSQADSEYPEHQKQTDKELKEMYELTTKKLVELESELEKAWDAVPPTDWKNINNPSRKSYNEVYGDVDRLEKEISDLKTKIMTWVVVNRECLWT